MPGLIAAFSLSSFCQRRTADVLSKSMGWLKGKYTGNHRFSHEIWDVPVIFPLIILNQSIDGSGLRKTSDFDSPSPCDLRRLTDRDRSFLFLAPLDSPMEMAGASIPLQCLLLKSLSEESRVTKLAQSLNIIEREIEDALKILILTY